jgi:hypothetical protein
MIESSGRIFISIYTPAISVLPALAIFLHEPGWKIVFYTSIISIFYCFNVFFPSEQSIYHFYPSEGARKIGIVIISILSLIMAVIIGAITK